MERTAVFPRRVVRARGDGRQPMTGSVLWLLLTLGIPLLGERAGFPPGIFWQVMLCTFPVMVGLLGAAAFRMSRVLTLREGRLTCTGWFGDTVVPVDAITDVTHRLEFWGGEDQVHWQRRFVFWAGTERLLQLNPEAWDRAGLEEVLRALPDWNGRIHLAPEVRAWLGP